MLFLVSVFKLIAEIALLCLVGQWVLGLLAGAGRERNTFYRIFQVLTGPFVRGARIITPRIVLDRHVPIVAFLILVFIWAAATLTKINLCLQIGIQQCR